MAKLLVSVYVDNGVRQRCRGLNSVNNRVGSVAEWERPPICLVLRLMKKRGFVSEAW